MMTKEKLNRISQLSKKSKTEGLTEAEKIEQQSLRKEYIQATRGNFISIMDNTVIQEKDGTKRKLRKKSANNKVQ